MQLIAEHDIIASTLKSFGRGLLTDDYSWRGWYMAVVTTRPSLHPLQQGKLASAMREELANYDGTILWLEHGPCVAIFRAPHGFDTSVLEMGLSHRVIWPRVELDVAVYGADDEPREILLCIKRYLIALRHMDLPDPMPLPDFSQHLQQADDLLSLWPQAYHTRRMRKDVHIMLVDDDDFTRSIVSQTLKHDHPMLTATDASEAFRKHILFAPDIVFLDVNMPGYDGFAFLRHLQKHDPHCMVVMFSGNHYLHNRLKAFASGANGFIPKPFHRRDFEHYIDVYRTDMQRQSADEVRP